MPHSLSALLTPTRAPHARLLKHWEGRIVSLVPVRHPHAHHMLACSLAGSHASSLARFSLARFFPRAFQLSLSFSLLRTYTLASFLVCFLSRLLLGSLARFFSPSVLTSNSFYIRGPSRWAQSPPKLTPPHLCTVTMTTCALEKKAGVGARERNECKSVC